MSETGCGSTSNKDDDSSLTPIATNIPTSTKLDTPPVFAQNFAANDEILKDDENLVTTLNVDLRYGGQYLTPEQLPEFCDQLHNLVEVIRNIQSYAAVTGEYPSQLEQRLEQEAHEVAALAAEARNARDVVTRTRAQRRALRAQRKHIVSHLATLKETEVRELENTIRLSDRKLYKSWESIKDSKDPADFGQILDDIKNKQIALDCLLRLIESRRSSFASITPTAPTPMPPKMPLGSNINEVSTTGASASTDLRPHKGQQPTAKRKRNDSTSRQPHSLPLSLDTSHHGPQVTLYIQGTEHPSRYRVGSAGAVALTPVELSTRGSDRDFLFFTSS